jgi:hypothetical protein
LSLLGILDAAVQFRCAAHAAATGLRVLSPRLDE